MNNELYRKLTSITLMTIMFAGGMTIAIPGETPVAIAQTGMLSVSATAAPGNSFGGPQIIEIVVDDPARSDIDPMISAPDVTIDGDNTCGDDTNRNWKVVRIYCIHGCCYCCE